MMTRLNQLGVPLVVFSAGIGNIIEMYLEQRLGQIPSNIHIISNMMNFDDKNSSVIRKEAGFFHDVSGRTNVLLLGDSMGDIHMDVGVEKDGPTLKLGFLNSDVQNLLDHYMDVYDVVLVQDQSMKVPDTIVQAIAAGYLKHR
ncbi:Pyrimidine 5'-nucleotidase [Cooperia oncophora]